MEYLINVSEVNKNYGSIPALDNVNIKAEQGKIIGLIGPDGAGKSTLMKIILTLEKADSGEVEVLKEKLPSGKIYIRNHVGYMPEIFSLYTDLSVLENLKFYYRIHKIKNVDFNEKVERLFKFNRLKKFSNTLAGQLSGGMKQKLALSCALMHDPSLLILDEPTTGVDPLSRREFWKMLSELKDQGITILVSTPYMDEAMQCDYIYLVHEGQVLNEGQPQHLIKAFPRTIYELTIENPQQYLNDLREQLSEQILFLAGKFIHISSMQHLSEEDFRDKLSGIVTSYKTTEVEPELEDIFLTLILQKGQSNANG